MFKQCFLMFLMTGEFLSPVIIPRLTYLVLLNKMKEKMHTVIQRDDRKWTGETQMAHFANGCLFPVAYFKALESFCCKNY